MLNFIGISITIFLAVILMGKSGKVRADYILIIWFIVIGFHLMLYNMVTSGNYIQFPHLLGLEIPIPLLYGPLLYLYTSELTGRGIKIKYQLLHFTPVSLAYLFVFQFFVLSVQEKIEVYQHEGEGFQNQKLLLLLAIIFSGIAYSILSWSKLRSHKRVINYQFSNTEKINLDWLRYLIIGIGIIWLTIFLGNETYIFTCLVIFVLFVGYFGIRQTQIFIDRPNPIISQVETIDLVENPILNASEQSLIEEDKLPKYSKSGLNEKDSLEIHRKLRDLMEKEKLFADPNLNLVELSTKLETNTNHLSQVINSIEKMSFYDYINGLRVSEFMAIASLPANQKYTLLHLALECGFNSKSSFNRNFKNKTGQSPSEFLIQENIKLGSNK